MKKVIFALAAVVALAACSNEETIIADKGAAIGFDTFVGKATRVNDPSLTTGNLKDFAVYGAVTNTVGTDSATALIFNNVKVAKEGITNNELQSVWKYEGTQYWIGGATYDFAAVAPFSCGQEDAFNASTKKTTIEFTNDGVTDLLYAQTTAQGEAGSGDAVHPANEMVGFTFRHILSKIKFSFENQYLSTGSTIRVYDVELYNAHSTGTATLDATSTTWTVGNDDLTIDFGDTENTTNDPAATSIVQGAEWESQNARFIIPGTLKIYSVNFKVDVLYDDTVVATYEHVATLEFTPEAGVAYDIKSVIRPDNIDPSSSQEPIEFTVTEVDAWDDYEDETAIIN